VKRSAREYAKLTPGLTAQLRRVPPSRDGRLEYHPCRVTLDDGRIVDCVYIVEAGAYLVKWGVWPEDDPGKRSVPIERVVTIEESPHRLPASLANRLYEAGESGMGYSLFTVEFRDGTEQAYVTGSAVDFIDPPPGLRASDAVRVLPHKGRDRGPREGPDYTWCLYAR
jgi:hypothetical protein